MKQTIRFILLMVMLSGTTLWGQEGKNIRDLGNIPSKAMMKNSAKENPWSEWSIYSEDKTATATFNPTGGRNGQPCVEIAYDGKGGWAYTSPLMKLEEAIVCLSALGWGQVSEGSLSFNTTMVKEKQTQKGRSAGGMYSQESNDWCQMLSSVNAEGYDGYRVYFSGQNKTRAKIGPVKVRSGEPIKAGERPKLKGYAKELKLEKLDRGFVAVPAKEGVYLGWRLLKSDPDKVGFNIYRKTGFTGNIEKLNREPVVQTTDFLDKTAKPGNEYFWQVKPVIGDKETGEVSEYKLNVPQPEKDVAKNYISIPLQGDYDVSRIAFADLNGDGKLDFVLKQPNKNVDPYHMPGYWKKSEGTFTIEAYDASGKFLWKNDLGWAIEQGIWYSPMIVFDLDGDGKAEVIAKTGKGDPRDETGRVHTHHEFLTVFNGETGKVITEIPWLSRLGYTYNLGCRNFLLVAYLDGKTPFLVAHRGTYGMMRMTAWQLVNGKLEEKLSWSNIYDLPLWGQGAHRVHAADVDGDGREEICEGSFVLDDDGTPLWQLGLGHPDHMYVGDLNPNNPGMEIYYGIETRKDKNGICMVDAKTGKYLWALPVKTWHIHANGICADLDAQFPGFECFSGEAKNDFSQDRYLHTADGKLLRKGPTEKDVLMPGLGAVTAYWDDTCQQVILRGNKQKGVMMKLHYPKVEYLTDTFQGNIVTVADILGDWREEIITTLPGEIRIYTTTIPAKNRRDTLLQDRNYRATTIENTVGYWLGPRLSYDMMTTPANR